MRILIVEDNEDAAESLALLLKLNGHEVRTAPDGIAALACLESYAPHAMLIDIGLPGMDGYELARAVRQRAGGVMLLAVSGYGSAEDKQHSAEAGFDVHLVKPVDFEALTTLLAAKAQDAGSRPQDCAVA